MHKIKRNICILIELLPRDYLRIEHVHDAESLGIDFLQTETTTHPHRALDTLRDDHQRLQGHSLGAGADSVVLGARAAGVAQLRLFDRAGEASAQQERLVVLEQRVVDAAEICKVLKETNTKSENYSVR